MTRGPALKDGNLARLLALLTLPGGFTVQSLAALLVGGSEEGVTPRTVQRYLRQLEPYWPIWCSADDPSLVDPTAAEAGKPRYGLLTEHFPLLPPLRLSTESAAMITALLAGLLRDGSPSTRQALLDLCTALLPRLPEPLRAVLQPYLDELAEQHPTSWHEAALIRTLAQGWALRRKVRASYLTDSSTRHYLLHIYRIEQIGPHLYAEAYIEEASHKPDKGKVRELRLDRIQPDAVLTDDTFEPVAAYEQTTERWRAARGTMADSPPVGVLLRFAPQVVALVEEEPWQRSQTVVRREADGALVVSYLVESTAGIARWIRGWGAQVEVLEPQALRESLRQEALAVARLYSHSHREVA